MKRNASLLPLFVWLTIASGGIVALAAEPATTLKISWADEFLSISGKDLPAPVRINYLEAYCRPGSTDREWGETVIKHRSELVASDAAGREIKLKNTLADGVVVDHRITAGEDEVTFQVSAHNPGQAASEAHWAQPCMEVGPFTGRTQQDYLPSCFVVLDGKPVRLPTEHWATKARYTPGQVWCPKGVDRNDVNPRPLSDLIPSHGLVGCYSADGKWILACACEPYQELFQGVRVCIHSDFRIGGLKPGETKQIRGKVYVTRQPIDKLIERYERDFPEQVPKR